jgi:hypothetical protein
MRRHHPVAAAAPIANDARQGTRSGGDCAPGERRSRSATVWRGVLTSVFLASGVPAGLARAQAAGGEAPPPNQFSFSLGLGERFTSNATLAPGGGDAEDDTIADLRADLSARRRSPRTEWSARYAPYYTRYRTHEQFDTSNHAFDFDGRYQVSRRGTLRLSERFFSSRNPLQIGTADTAEETIILTRQTSRWRSLTDASFDASLSRTLTFLAGASTRIERFDPSPPTDTLTSTGRVGLQKQMGREDSLAASYSYSRFAFGDESRDIVGHGLGVSWSHTAPAPTEWELAVGVSNVTRGDERQNRLTAAASLRHRFRRLDWVTAYRRSIGADSGVANVTVGQNAHVAVTATVGRRGTLGVRGEYGTRDSVLDEGDLLALRYVGGAVHGSFAFNPTLSLAVEARRRKQEIAEGAGEDVTVDTFFAGLAIRIF